MVSNERFDDANGRCAPVADGEVQYQREVAPFPSACARPACPACGGALVEIRAKLQCSVCRVIVETCCEGGRG